MEEKIENGRVYLTRKEFRDRMDEQNEKIEKLTRVISGDEDLNVNPIRGDVKNLVSRVYTLEKLVDRGKWFFLGFGLLESSRLVAFIVSLLEIK